MKFLRTEEDATRPKVFQLLRVYRCRCKRPVFFANSKCLGCGTALGYEPYLGKVMPLTPGSQEGTWRVPGSRRGYRRCANLETAAACNWLVRVEGGQTLCISCRLNRTVPDLSIAENGVLWGKIEAAKRRVISSLVALGLPLDGLTFDFLRSPEGGPPVMTGHNNGVITLNIEEADDARREFVRSQMGEPYRTLVGHFRHEVGHFYWDKLIRDTQWLEGFRRQYGDETADYGAALQKHHAQGPPPDWSRNFISAYASSHPWEDWAETWAHYLHMVDTLAAATSFGLDKAPADLRFDLFKKDALDRPEDPDADRFLSSLNSWVELSAVLNELARSMGQPDLYPFALPRAAVAKLQFIDTVIMSPRA